MTDETAKASSEQSYSPSRELCTTDELVRYYTDELAHVPITRAKLEAAIPAAINALYENRDNGGNMHSAGAEVAVAVLMGCRRP